MAEPTWETVAIPIMDAVDALQREGVGSVALVKIAEQSGLTFEQVEAEIDLLVAAGYVGYEVVREQGRPRAARLNFAQVYEKGARIIGRWPSSDPYDALLELLDRRILDDRIDDDTRSSLRKLRGALVDVGKGAAGGVLAALVRTGLGL